jgi:hypothetical protein
MVRFEPTIFCSVGVDDDNNTTPAWTGKYFHFHQLKSCPSFAKLTFCSRQMSQPLAVVSINWFPTVKIRLPLDASKIHFGIFRIQFSAMVVLSSFFCQRYKNFTAGYSHNIRYINTVYLRWPQIYFLKLIGLQFVISSILISSNMELNNRNTKAFLNSLRKIYVAIYVKL